MKPTFQRLSLALMLVVTGLAATMSVSSQTGGDATPDATMEAAVAQLFQQTADAVINQTATAAASADGTATAMALVAPTQTVEALFRQAMTATASALVPPFASYELIDVQELDLLAGPGRTGAHLSPDGTRFLHVERREACLYELGDDGVWAQGECGEIESEAFNNPEEMRWSPDGQWLTMPTYEQALLNFRDSDIAVLNVDDLSVLPITPDDATESLMTGEYSGNFDIAAHWRDADTLVFLRYLADRPGTSGIRLGLPHLMQIDLNGGEAEELMTLPVTLPLAAYATGISADGSRFVYSADYRNSEAGQGIWSVDLNTLEVKQVIELDAREAPLPLSLQVSAQGDYVLLVKPVEAASRGAPTAGLDVVNLVTGELMPVDPDRIALAAGYAPRGNGIAYIVRDPVNPDDSGLYISAEPGVPGKQILQGDFWLPTCCGRVPLDWAANDTILIGRGGMTGLLVVKVGVR